MNAPRPTRVLLDMMRGLEPSYAGIPQDSRLIFRALASSPSVELTSMLYRLSMRPVGFEKHLATPDVALQSSLLAQVLDEPPPKPSWLAKLRIDRLQRLIEPFTPYSARLNYIDAQHFADTLWDSVLAKSLPLVDRGLVTRSRWAISSFTDWDQVERTHRGGLPVRFDASSYDFLVMQDVRYLKVNGAKKLIRFHDAIPALYPQLVTAGHQRWFIENFIATCKDGYFVCNSENTRREGELLFPGFTARSCVIPCAIAEPPKAEAAKERPDDVWSIVRRRRVSKAADVLKATEPPAKSTTVPDYILSVSTIETRKNYATTVRALEVLKKEFPSMKLIVVGRTGGITGDVMPAFEAHARQGNLIHLQNVSESELRALYSNARVLVFASIAEGFGLTPAEALSNGCPAIVSDIATHREVYGDSVVYFDPRDHHALAAQLRRFFKNKKEAAALTEDLLSRSERALKRYRPRQVQAQWEQLFEELKPARS